MSNGVVVALYITMLAVVLIGGYLIYRVVSRSAPQNPGARGPAARPMPPKPRPSATEDMPDFWDGSNPWPLEPGQERRG